MAAKRRGLDSYRSKRRAGRTTEPFGSTVTSIAGNRGIFVVQLHQARRRHYDFRLELDGVLVSWAVPRGPSLDPAAKRIAIHVEDHPLDYADFEGIIPDDNYGAGPVIVWDRGYFTLIEGEGHGLEHGKLLFDLHGYKLHGRWTLVQTRKSREPTNEWLLIKKQDDAADPAAELSDASIDSGLHVEELTSLQSAIDERIEELHALGALARRIDASRIKPMLCQPIEEAFSDDGWIFELKYDGYRLISSVEDGEPFLRYRRGPDATELYPEIARSLQRLPVRRCVLDGEVVVFDEAGRSDFGKLQKRALLGRKSDVQRAMRILPATYVVFDLLELEGYDLRKQPLSLRKRLLAQIVPKLGPVKYCEHIEARGEALFEQVEALDLEGIVAKRMDSTYVGRRSPAWRKLRRARADDFAVVGYSESKSGRAGFGALHLAVCEAGGWSYAGRCGGGFSADELVAVRAQLDALEEASYPFAAEVANGADHWVEPHLVAMVRYKEWRDGKLLREPIFERMRPDKLPEECLRPEAHASDMPPEPEVQDGAEASPELVLSNRDKVFWPEEGYTKGELLDYYEAISPWLLPYLEERPLVLTRYPDGIEGKSFYQKNAPSWAPDWIETATVWSEHAQREIHYFVVNRLEDLLYLVNLGSIPLHVWPSRTRDLARPDWCILDLDPKGAPWADVVRCARSIQALCVEIGLPVYLKTSGSSGLHILIPLGAQCTYEQSRHLAHVIFQAVLPEISQIATLERSLRKREGKVYLDGLQNRHGQLLVAPFSVRPLAGATVSMPLRWNELRPGLDFRKYNIKSAPARMRRLREDPNAGVLTQRPDLIAALDRLRERMEPA
jgi:bifunctional non-homologous end joining protein LigD